MTDALLKAGVKGVAYETLIERNRSIPLAGAYESDRRTSQCSGRCKISGEAVRWFWCSALSGVPGTPKAKVVILGAGSVGTNACKIAVGMGADVTIMDINLKRLAYLDDIFGATDPDTGTVPTRLWKKAVSRCRS